MTLATGEKKDITLAKGLAIILVVAGHILGRSYSEGNEWYEEVKTWIYLYHMPFFMFLSGYLYFHPGRLAGLSGHYRAHVKKQSIRLLLPFLFMGLGILVLKLALQSFMPVDNVPGNFADGLVGLFWHTRHSPSMFIWYIFALYVFSLTSPLLFRVIKERMHWWIVIGLALYLLPSLDYLYLNKITGFFIFFCIGGALRHAEPRYIAAIDTYFFLWLLLFAASFSLFYLFDIPRDLYLLGIGLASIPALHGLCRFILRFGESALEPLMELGRCSYSIYLFNTLAIGATKVVIFKLADWHYENFLWSAPLLVFAGLYAPLLAEKWVLFRIPFIRREILGKPDAAVGRRSGEQHIGHHH